MYVRTLVKIEIKMQRCRIAGTKPTEERQSEWWKSFFLSYKRYEKCIQNKRPTLPKLLEMGSTQAANLMHAQHARTHTCKIWARKLGSVVRVTHTHTWTVNAFPTISAAIKNLISNKSKVTDRAKWWKNEDMMRIAVRHWQPLSPTTAAAIAPAGHRRTAANSHPRKHLHRKTTHSPEIVISSVSQFYDFIIRYIRMRRASPRNSWILWHFIWIDSTGAPNHMHRMQNTLCGARCLGAWDALDGAVLPFGFRFRFEWVGSRNIFIESLLLPYCPLWRISFIRILLMGWNAQQYGITWIGKRKSNIRLNMA